MYNVSSNFLSAVAGNDRTVKLKATFNSKTELDGEHLFNYTLTEMINSEGITMGAVCSNKIEIKMAMPSTSIALANGWVEPKVGLEINGTVEYVPLGKFYITEIESKDDYKTVTITGYDGMCKLEEEYETTITTWPASISAVVNDIATQYGFEVATTTFPSYTIDYIEGTCREYLGWIAGLMGKNARFNRDGKLEFKWYKTVSNYSISRALQYQNGLERTRTDSFTVSSITSGTEDNVLVAGNGVGITFENPFITQEILNSIKSSIGTVTFKPCEVKWHGNPALEVGDIVTVKDKNDSNLTVYVMEQTINIGGGISGEIFCYGESETSIAFSTEGPTGREIKKLKQNYNDLQEAIANATDIINSTKGGIFKITDSDNDGVNDGWLLAEHDGDLTSTTKCIVGNYQGIGWSTNGGATYTQAITHEGIVGSAIVAGSITANKISMTDVNELGATIAGWTISTNRIYSQNEDGTYNSINNASGSSFAFAAGASSLSVTTDAPFRVTQAGKLYATGAEIKGKITAESGTIAGYNIGSGGSYNRALYRRTSSTSTTSNPAYEVGIKADSGATDLAFYVKKSTNSWSSSSNIFYINNSGKLYCENADITGTITASSGEIGGWNIGALGTYTQSLYSTYCAASSPSTTNPEYAVFMRSYGGPSNLAIGVKKRTSSSTGWADADNPFYVRKDGYVLMKNANITGEIHADSGTIDGNLEIGGALTHTRGDYKVTLRGVQSTLSNGVFYIADSSSGSTKYPVRINGDGSASFTNVSISGDSSIASACIPNLSATKITSGTISTDRLSTSVITTSNFSAKTLTTGNLTVDNGCYVGSWYIGSGGLTSGNVHITTNALVYGSRQCTWADVTACVQAYTSDRRLKNSINAMDDKYSELFDNLNPVIYKFNSDGDSAKTRIGFVAQDVQGAIIKAGLEDMNCVYASEGVEEDYLRLSYTDFIALNTREIQKLKARVAELEAKLDSVI